MSPERLTAETGCCDFCAFYAFNGNEHGVYLNLGRCEHPAHPRPSDPGDLCDDFAYDPCPSACDERSRVTPVMDVCRCGHSRDSHAHPGWMGTPCAILGCYCKRFAACPPPEEEK